MLRDRKRIPGPTARAYTVVALVLGALSCAGRAGKDLEGHFLAGRKMSDRLNTLLWAVPFRAFSAGRHTQIA